mgnify:CR=1 FL=1
MNNINNNQENHFDEYAFDWWNKTGNYELLHNLNPCRLEYILSRFELKNKKILDVGCGGGIFSEELSKFGAKVTGIDSSTKSVNIAKQHAKENNLDIEYINGSILDIENLEKYDCIVCFEMIEHINEPNKLIEKIESLSTKGTHLFMSTINRNIKSFIFAKVMAEYILKFVPLGTHQYAKFVTPYEINELLEINDFKLKSIDGIAFNPVSKSFKLSKNPDINYFIHAQK